MALRTQLGSTFAVLCFRVTLPPARRDHPRPDDPETRTRLYYSVQVAMFDWVPKFIVDMMSAKALTDATAWVKKYSELEWAKAKEEGRADASPPPKGAEPRFVLPFGGKKRRLEEERRAREEEEAERAALEEQARVAERRRGLTVAAGWRRYLLVSLVLTLAAVNASLFFGDAASRNSD